jgi:hypothetical protein
VVIQGRCVRLTGVPAVEPPHARSPAQIKRGIKIMGEEGSA